MKPPAPGTAAPVPPAGRRAQRRGCPGCSPRGMRSLSLRSGEELNKMQSSPKRPLFGTVKPQKYAPFSAQQRPSAAAWSRDQSFGEAGAKSNAVIPSQASIHKRAHSSPREASDQLKIKITNIKAPETDPVPPPSVPGSATETRPRTG